MNLIVEQAENLLNVPFCPWLVVQETTRRFPWHLQEQYWRKKVRHEAVKCKSELTSGWSHQVE